MKKKWLTYGVLAGAAYLIYNQTKKATVAGLGAFRLMPPRNCPIMSKGYVPNGRGGVYGWNPTPPIGLFKVEYGPGIMKTVPRSCFECPDWPGVGGDCKYS